MNPYASAAIVGGVIIALGLLLAAARRGAPAATADGGLVFRHSAVFRWLALAMAVIPPAGVTALLFVVPIKDAGDVWAIVGLYGLCLVLGFPLLWETQRYALVVTPEGLDCHSPWRGRFYIAWADVERLSYSGVNSWFVIHAATGQRFRVSVFVAGVGDFLAECERHLPPARLFQALPGYRFIGRAFPDDGSNARRRR